MQRFGQGSPYLRIKGILTTPEGKAAWNVMQKFHASDVHLYLFGPDGIYQNGYQPGNYFDSAGTQLANVDGSVGAVLDAAGSVGAELVTGQVWTTGSANTSISGGNVTVFSGAASGAVGSAAFTVTPGKTYRTTFTVSGLTAGQIGVDVGGASTYTNINSNGTFTQNTVCAGGAAIYAVSKAAGTSASVQIISVREVTGIHATQSTPGFKPTPRKGIVNLLTWSNDLTNAAWSLLGAATRSTVAGSSPTGGNSTRLQSSAVDQGIRQYQITVAGPYTGAFLLKSNTGSPQTVALRYFNNTGQFIREVVLTSEWQLFAEPNTATAGANFQFDIKSTVATPVMDILVASCGLFAGTLTAAQILAAGGIPLTTTAPASSQAGPNCLEFDGVDDWLSFSTPAFQFADDQATVVSASNRSIGTVANKIIYSPATENTSGIKRMAQISYDTTIQMVSASWYDGTNYDNLLFAWPIGVPFVAVAWKVGSTLKLRVNGVERVSKAMTITSFTANRGTLGNYDPPQAVNAFHGEVYFASALKGTLTLADVQLLEKQAASIAGIQL